MRPGLSLARRAGRGRGSRRSPAASHYAGAPLAPGRTPWRQGGWCALDFELTGLDPRRAEIISFGAIPIDDGRVHLAGAVSGLIRPVRELGEASIRVHGLRASDLARAPRLAEALSGLLPALAGRGLVVHAAAVERGFLRPALAELGVRLRGPIVDTEALGRLWLYERDGVLRRRITLGQLAAALNLPAERPHHALGDALTAAQAFIALASHLDARHPETVGSLARAGERLANLRAYDAGDRLSP
jgi:DNA polymerase-3 subunit epsilon